MARRKAVGMSNAVGAWLFHFIRSKPPMESTRSGRSDPRPLSVKTGELGWWWGQAWHDDVWCAASVRVKVARRIDVQSVAGAGSIPDLARRGPQLPGAAVPPFMWGTAVFLLGWWVRWPPPPGKAPQGLGLS